MAAQEWRAEFVVHKIPVSAGLSFSGNESDTERGEVASIPKPVWKVLGTNITILRFEIQPFFKMRDPGKSAHTVK